MAVSISPTDIGDVWVIESQIFRDDRGYFTELYNAKAWAEAGFDHSFVQDNMSVSAKGTLRGLHYQVNPAGQGKLVRALRVSVFAVVVAVCVGSPT